MSHWSILGSGVTALCAATVLYEHGETIEIIEQPLIQAASYWAGGMLAPYCEGESAPEYITQNSLSSIDWWQQHVPDVQQNGTLVIAPSRDQVELTRFAARTQAHSLCQAVDIEADLAHFKQALFFASEAHLHPRQALAHLKQLLVEAGVSIHTGAARGKIIDCRGIHAKAQLENLRAVRGEMLMLHNPHVDFQRPIRLLHPRFPCYLVPRGSGIYMLGATMLETDDASEISARSMMELLNAAYSIHPSFADAKVLETGVGLRPSYPDNIPKIHEQDGTFYLNGMYRHGFLFAPVLAQQLLHKIQG